MGPPATFTPSRRDRDARCCGALYLSPERNQRPLTEFSLKLTLLRPCYCQEVRGLTLALHADGKPAHLPASRPTVMGEAAEPLSLFNQPPQNPHIFWRTRPAASAAFETTEKQARKS